MSARKIVSPEKLKAADEYVFYHETPAAVLWLSFLLLAENLFFSLFIYSCDKASCTLITIHIVL